eukprot:gene9352-biopygen8467
MSDPSLLAALAARWADISHGRRPARRLDLGSERRVRGRRARGTERDQGNWPEPRNRAPSFFMRTSPLWELDLAGAASRHEMEMLARGSKRFSGIQGPSRPLWPAPSGRSVFRIDFPFGLGARSA